MEMRKKKESEKRQDSGLKEVLCYSPQTPSFSPRNLQFLVCPLELKPKSLKRTDDQV